YTSARDLAILTTALIKEFPEYYRWFSQKEFTYNKITQQNRNKLLSRDESVDGVKTGFTDDAGYCLVASALREDMRLISVVMGTKSALARANENQTLINYGFRFYESHRLYEGNKPLNETKIWKGASKTIALGLAEDLYVTIPRRLYPDLKAVINVDKNIIAPIAEHTKLGTVKVTLKDDLIIEKDLVSLQAIDQGNIFHRLFDSAMLMIEKSNDGK
ncbi:MAG: serine-type D-Ala-D-Ala carboxypeptidase, partial [Methylococcales bacterium]|nr:serine-type D-Ala-D-Ala carboxypeptidase [Methylococcales bacterium]